MKKYKRSKHLKVETGTPEYRKACYIKHMYGITYEDYLELRKRQEEKCAICGLTEEESGKTLSIDHCHDTKKVRGLLCHNCNHAIGKFKHNAGILYSAMVYLESRK